MSNQRYVNVSLTWNGDLVWHGHDLGEAVRVWIGGTEYEFWRTIRAAYIGALVVALGGQTHDDVVRLVRERFDSDIELRDFAAAHRIPTEFSSWISTPTDD